MGIGLCHLKALSGVTFVIWRNFDVANFFCHFFEISKKWKYPYWLLQTLFNISYSFFSVNFASFEKLRDYRRTYNFYSNFWFLLEVYQLQQFGSILQWQRPKKRDEVECQNPCAENCLRVLLIFLLPIPELTLVRMIFCFSCWCKFLSIHCSL